MDPTVRHAKSMAACKKLLDQPEFATADVLMVYLPLPTEVDTTPIVLRSWQLQKTLTAPRLSWDLRHMLPVEIRSLDTDVVETRYGLREPVGGEPLPVEMLALVVVPALAYDRKGNRLGRGAGFYDRFLGSPQFKGKTVGLAFQEQLVDALPTTENDRPVDLLVTDEEVLRFARL